MQVVQWGEHTSLYNGLLRVDSYTLFFQCLFLLIGVFIILCSVEYVSKHLIHQGEYYALILLAVLGTIAMSASTELLTAYISLELMSFTFYTMVAYDRYNPKSNEAGLKYILVGAFSSAILLFGISMLYGVVGVTRFSDIADEIQFIQQIDGVSPSL